MRRYPRKGETYEYRGKLLKITDTDGAMIKVEDKWYPI